MRLLRLIPTSFLVWLLPLVARADHTPEHFLSLTGEVGARYRPVEPAVLVGSIINIFLSVIGVIMVVLMVYGGYLWMTARGDEDRVKQAKSTLQNAVIGIVIILLAYSISSFVVRGLVAASFGT